MSRQTKTLILPILFYILALLIMLSFVSVTDETRSMFKIFSWILVSLSLKLSFGTFCHDPAEKVLSAILAAEGYPISSWILLKVALLTFIFSGLFVGVFLGTYLIQLFSIQDVMIVPLFIGSLLVLQAGVELLTLKTKVARYLCYLLLLPLEVPLFIIVISQNHLTKVQLLKTMGGFALLSGGILLFFCSFVFKRNKNPCNF